MRFKKEAIKVIDRRIASFIGAKEPMTKSYYLLWYCRMLIYHDQKRKNRVVKNKKDKRDGTFLQY